MTATDELRAMLDERGVEYRPWDDGVHPITNWYVNGWAYEHVEFRLINGAKQVNKWDNDGHCMLTITNRHCSPEQAIAATLGAGTCKNKATSLRTFWCDCCDCALEDWMDVGGKLVNGLHYCPNCGAKVVD